MKKYGLILATLVLGLIVSGCVVQSSEDYISKQINIHIPNVLSIEQTDDHGGFHGDGQRVVKIKFDNNNGEAILSQIKKSDIWNRMPLSENLNLIMYGGIREGIEYSYNLAKESGIPEVNNGYWYFIDRHSGSIKKEEDIDLFNRYSFNFTLAICDVENNELYYFEFDT